MRTTIEMPDALFRVLKAQAALRGISLRDLVQQLIEIGLQTNSLSTAKHLGHKQSPPTIIPKAGKPIQAVSAKLLRQLEADEDENRHARSS